jgi:hypothetical protein
MAHGDERLTPIAWSSTDAKPAVARELERDLRQICQRSDRVDPDLAQDVLFWLDLGGNPQAVARWLRDEMDDGHNAARFPTRGASPALFSRDQRPGGGQQRTRRSSARARHEDVPPVAEPTAPRVRGFWAMTINFMLFAFKITRRRRSGRRPTRSDAAVSR